MTAIQKAVTEQGEEGTVVGSTVCLVEEHRTREWASASIVRTGPQEEGLVTWEALAQVVEELQYASDPFGSQARRVMSLGFAPAGASEVDALHAAF